MRLLGIDYGEKRTGIAFSDEDGTFAFPLEVIENKTTLEAVKKIKKVCEENNIGKIILGESLNYKGERNPVMKKIEKFKIILEKEINLPVVYQSETMTTKEAERGQKKPLRRGDTRLRSAELRRGKAKNLDASAAALILTSYIEKQNMIK